MNLKARLEGEEFDLEVRRNDDGGFVVELDGRSFEVGLSEPEPGVLSLLVADGSFEAVVRTVGDETDVTVRRAHDHASAVIDPPAAHAAPLRRLPHGGVLQVPQQHRELGIAQPCHREVGGLRPPAGEHHVLGCESQRLRDAFARALKFAARPPPRGRARRSI